jgi:thymidylate synthase (FAD)
LSPIIERINTLLFPVVNANVFTTENGTPYLKAPGVVTLAMPQVMTDNLNVFLGNFDPALGFDDYLTDPDRLQPGETLTKVAGQLCYMSFGPKRTKNADASRYIDNIKSSGHGSVLEHATVSLLLYGISRSITHELVRHRAGTAFSQVSQRYVSGKVLRFVERPEYQNDEYLHSRFERHIDRAAAEYDELAQYLLQKQAEGDPTLSGESKTDLRKRVQQAARSELPNAAEAPMVMSANIRSWRHIIEMRAEPHAEPEIRRLAYNIYLCLNQIAPILFEDYESVTLPDGTNAVKTNYRKV